jgi:hypothetical protein
MWGFVTTNLYRVGSSAPRPVTNLEDQGISLSLTPPSKPVQHGCPYQQLLCRRHSFEFTGSRKPPHPATKCFRQGRDTIEGAYCLYSHQIQEGSSFSPRWECKVSPKCRTCCFNASTQSGQHCISVHKLNRTSLSSGQRSYFVFGSSRLQILALRWFIMAKGFRCMSSVRQWPGLKLKLYHCTPRRRLGREEV